MSKIIIIHPGSLYLRIGKASDLNPEMILNCVARKRKGKDPGNIHQDSILPESSKTKDIIHEMDESRLSVSHMLQNCLQTNGRKRYGTPSQQLASFNKRVHPEIVSGQPEVFWLKPKEKVNTIVGAEVLRLDPNGNFNIHFPIRRGEFNIHKGIGGSMFSVLEDIRTIWEYSIKNYLDINIKDLNQYKAVLIIPDIYNRKRIKELTALIFKMGFSACFLVQEHVAATFGSGLSYACVVDIGDQKISISCIEDALSHPNTRVSLKFGGGDVTMCFFWLLQKVAFPYKECQPNNNQDAVLLNHLKESSCHIDMNICGSQEKSFIINRPEQSPVRYVLQVADELLIAPLSLFHTDLLKFSLGNTNRDKIIQIQKTLGQDFDSEDCFNAEFLRETGRRANAGYTKDQTENSFNANDGNAMDADDEIVVDETDKDLLKFNANDFQTSTGQVSGLESAILQSIEHLPNEELKKKMYNCVLLVGGSSKIPGLARWLQTKIQQAIPLTYRTESQDIVMTPKDVDPGHIVWRGASVMAGLEASEELWITKEDFENYGVRILREKVPFIW
ncbi:CLUMA_CG006564, isoform A [Clunio marinus]|uniref:CLUMA_CG006564, isoform A n=1 Tax=Clunio marinus TaxID=568069 RepID=A0A1J1HYD6_9DIPT|nr:CLUMA_CG006564, isoform A [Clunio marinus]